MEHAFDILGMSKKNVEEFASDNMQDFNEVAVDADSVGYYSFGSKKKELEISEVLRPAYKIITDFAIETECDGMVDVHSTKWGTYILTFNQDHFEIAGMQPGTKSHVVNILTDNLRVDELIQENGSEDGRAELKFAF
jgi:hypothetical protein